MDNLSKQEKVIQKKVNKILLGNGKIGKIIKIRKEKHS